MLTLFVSLYWCTITVCPFVCIGHIYFPLCLKRHAGNKPNVSGVDGFTRAQNGRKNDSWADLTQKLLALKSDLLSCQNFDI